MKCGALPGTRGTEQRDQLVCLDAEIEPSQGHRLDAVGAKDLEDVVKLECSEDDLVALLRLTVEARYLHRKLWIINR